MLVGALVCSIKARGEVHKDAVRVVHPLEETEEWDAVANVYAGGQASEAASLLPTAHSYGDRLDVC